MSERCACGVERTEAWLCPACGRPPAMLRDSDRWRTCLHEAGHAVVGLAVGLSPEVVSIRPSLTHRGVTIMARGTYAERPGEGAAFFDRSLPLSMRDLLEAHIAVDLAGELAGLLALASGYQSAADLDDEAHARRVATAITGLDPERQARLETAAAAPESSDDWDRAVASAGALLARNEDAAGALLAFVRAITAALVYRHVRTIFALARELDLHETLSGERVRALCPSL